ncbi:MAG: 2OG-Fe(II) oxygenase [Candidatus Tyrphobacter sp.]
MDVNARALAGIGPALDERGFALAPGLLGAQQCAHLRALYDDASRFRSRIVMQRHAFGRGEYKYFAHPLPPLVAALRERLYASLAPIANTWMACMEIERRFPATHGEFLDECAASAQTKPTALLLKYEAGDYNCLHEDLYGPVVFPLQATIYLSRPGVEFDGGDVVLTERRPRKQVRAHVLSPRQGDLLVFASHAAPQRSERGIVRIYFKHGVSTVARGTRYTLGIIFHDAL